MSKSDWVRLGHWDFRRDEVYALHFQADGSVKIHLGNALVIPLGPDDAAAFLSDFGPFRNLKDLSRRSPGADEVGGIPEGGVTGSGPEPVPPEESY